MPKSDKAEPGPSPKPPPGPGGAGGAVPAPRRRRVRRPSGSGPKVSDILALSVAARLYGIFIAGICVFIILMSCEFHMSLWFDREMLPFWGGIVVAVLCFVIGRGMARFRPWAWWGGVAVLVPLYGIIGGFALVHSLAAYGTGRGGVVPGYIGLSVYVFMPLTVLLAIWVLWVLLSKGGRRRYQRQYEILEAARANPDSILGRAYGFRRPPPKPAAALEDASEAPPDEAEEAPEAEDGPAKGS